MIDVTHEADGAATSRGTRPARAPTPARAPAPPGRSDGTPPDSRLARAGVAGWPGRGYLTEPAVMPATRNRWSSRKPTTIGTLTVSDAAMIWFQYTWFWVA